MNLKLLTGVIVSTAFLLPGSASGQTADFNIVPQPLQADVTNDAPFILNGKTSIVVATPNNDRSAMPPYSHRISNRLLVCAPVSESRARMLQLLSFLSTRQSATLKATSSMSTLNASALLEHQQPVCSTAYKPCVSRCP